MSEPERILLVDDDPDFLAMTREILEANGYRTISARSAREAVDLLDAEKPDLVITDMLMETTLAGLEVARKVKDDPALEGIPVLALSGMKGERGLKFSPSEEELEMAGVDRYFEKPIEPDRLLAQVRELLSPERTKEGR